MPSSKIQYTSLDPQIFSGVAQEETSQVIKSIINTINTNANTAATKATSAAKDTTDIKSQLTTLDTSLQEAFTYLFSLVGSGGNSIIKSIQRGISNTNNSGTAIQISPVNIDKSIVLFTNNGTGTWKTNNGNDRQGYIYLHTFTSTSITFYCDSYTTTAFDWQVIEFY